MTGLQEIQDDILGLEAALAGKRLELAMAKGERIEAKTHLADMEKAVRERRGFRIQCGMSDGGCYFNAMGHADQVQGRVAHA